MVIELVGDWSFEICHSAAVANSSLFTLHFFGVFLGYISFVNSFYFSFRCFGSLVPISPMGGKEVFLCLLRSIGGGRRRHSDEVSEALRCRARSPVSFICCKGTISPVRFTNTSQEFSLGKRIFLIGPNFFNYSNSLQDLRVAPEHLRSARKRHKCRARG